MTGLAGCLGSLTGGSGGAEGSRNPPKGSGETDGYPPTFDDPPKKPSADAGSFETTDVDGTAVPLAPIDVVYPWYMNRMARMVDARSQTAYDAAHIVGAVSSPAPDGTTDDPVAGWPKGDRIICYCGCPHHLSAMRAATLIEKGFENVMVIDEGFGEWGDRGYPMAGSDVKNRPEPRKITGMTGPEHAGGDAWARHEPSGQMEAGPIAADGSFELVLKFVDVTAESVISIETPAYRFEAPLGELEGTVITPEMAD